MNTFSKLSPIVQILTIICVSGIVVTALINQQAGAALVALVAAVAAAVARKGNDNIDD